MSGVTEGQLSTAVQAKLNSGGGDDTTTWGFDIDEIFDGDTDGVQVADTVQNTFMSPDDISSADWSTTDTDIDGTDGMIPISTGGTVHRLIQGQAMVIGQTYTISIDAVPENVGQWMMIPLPLVSLTSEVYFDAVNGVFGNVPAALTGTRVVGLVGGGFRFFFSFVADTAIQQVRVYLAENNGDVFFIGDDTVWMRVSRHHMYIGGVSDDVRYPYNTTAAVPYATTVSKLIYKQAKWDAGLAQKAGDPNVVTNWVPASSVTTATGAMDASPGNVAALRRAGLHQVVSTGAWGPLVAGTQFWANDDSGDYVTLFLDDVATGASSKQFTEPDDPNDPGGSDTELVLVRVLDGNVRDLGNGTNFMIPGYKSANSFGGIDTYPGFVVVTFGLDYTYNPEGARVRVLLQYRYEPNIT